MALAFVLLIISSCISGVSCHACLFTKCELQRAGVTFYFSHLGDTQTYSGHWSIFLDELIGYSQGIFIQNMMHILWIMTHDLMFYVQK